MVCPEQKIRLPATLTTIQHTIGQVGVRPSRQKTDEDEREKYPALQSGSCWGLKGWFSREQSTSTQKLTFLRSARTGLRQRKEFARRARKISSPTIRIMLGPEGLVQPGTEYKYTEAYLSSVCTDWSSPAKGVCIALTRSARVERNKPGRCWDSTKLNFWSGCERLALDMLRLSTSGRQPGLLTQLRLALRRLALEIPRRRRPQYKSPVGVIGLQTVLHDLEERSLLVHESIFS